MKTTTKVILAGWRKGCQTISCIQLVRNRTNIGLGLAKHMIEDCLEGKQTVFEMKSTKDAEVFITELEDLGFIAKLERCVAGKRKVYHSGNRKVYHPLAG